MEFLAEPKPKFDSDYEISDKKNQLKDKRMIDALDPLDRVDA